MRRNLLQHFQPLAGHSELEAGKASKVAARFRQALDEAATNRINKENEYNRYCTGRLLQYRNKSSNARVMLEHARELKRRLARVHLIMNDRADLCLAAQFNGVHVGQEDLSPDGARRTIGPQLWLGASTAGALRNITALNRVAR